MSDVTDLIERLRATRVIGFTGGGAVSGDGMGTSYGEPVRQLVNPDGPEAADALERITAQSDAAAAERGWLIETTAAGFTHWIALSDEGWPRVRIREKRIIEKYISPVRYVKDANDALRFARKEDGEAFLKLFGSFILGASVTEHEWPVATLPTQSDAGIAEEEAEAIGDADNEAVDYWTASHIARRIRRSAK